MPAKDVIHDAVKNALVKDGWTITDDPLRLKYKAVNLSVDLGAGSTALSTSLRRSLLQ
jgi:hypothetical protein